MSSRKILIVAIVALVLIVCVGLYFLLFAGKGSPAGNTGQTGTLPTTGTQSGTGTTGTAGNASSSGTGSAAGAALMKSFGVALNQPALDYFVDSSNTITAVEPNGNIVQVADGTMSTLSSIVMQNVLSASFSYDGAKILVSLGGSSNTQASVFDLATKAWTALPAGLQSPTWSPSDYRVAYLTQGTQGTETLATIDTSKAKLVATALVTLHVQDLAVAWPIKTQITLYAKPSAYVAGSALAYNTQKKTLTPIAIEAPGLALLWSGNSFSGAAPMGLEFSSGASNLGGSLSLIDVSGNTLQRLKLNTLPSKCLFASATSTPYLFCGVPRDQNTFSISHLPDDYNQMALFTSDDIYRINLQSGAIDVVFNDQTQNLDISDVKFFNDTLFFVNRYNQEVYGIGLITM